MPRKVERTTSNPYGATGPLTVKGKLRSSRNSTKHGYSSKSVVVPEGTKGHYLRLRAALRARLNPVSRDEKAIFDEIVRSSWNLLRIGRELRMLERYQRLNVSTLRKAGEAFLTLRTEEAEGLDTASLSPTALLPDFEDFDLANDPAESGESIAA